MTSNHASKKSVTHMPLKIMIELERQG